MIQVLFRIFQVLCPIILVAWRMPLAETLTVCITTWASSLVDNIPDNSFASVKLEKMGQQFHHHFVVGSSYCSLTVVAYVTAFSCFSPDLSGNTVGGPCFMKPPKSVRNMRAAWMVKTSGASGALWKPCQSWHAAADCVARYKKHRLHDAIVLNLQFIWGWFSKTTYF